ncbi:hypothetical protein FSARC_12814 [Fusarium sarcochroum]|uniref:Uncharacterized protein n=1 Tax=Fusarium sarcochroum TaxID=1208366 RepID=A0A8H4T5S4_9HYPO|nr:hypothetical protein FSARC_12814 [Fusarium sarcochroum]
MDDLAVDLQLSRIISAFEQTTIFTSITPNPTAQADVTTGAQEPTVTVTQESSADDSSPGHKIFGALEVIIALGAVVVVLILIMGIILCDRRRKAKRRRAANRSQKRMTNEKSGQAAGHIPPTGARLPEGIWPRMAEKNQKVYDYWHNETSNRPQGWDQAPQAGMQQGLHRYQ